MVRLTFPLLWLLASLAGTAAPLSAPAPEAPPTRPAEFSFEARTGVSNRLLTPNGDGKNDAVVFRFANPRDSAVTGRILDLLGHVVADLAPGPAGGTSLLWDGRSGGQVVSSGVYLFVLEGESRAYAGVVVVIR